MNMNPNELYKMSFADKIVVHDHKEHLKKQKQLLDEAAITPDNKELIIDFVNFCKSQGNIGDARLVKYMYSLRRIGELIDKSFKEINEKDINTLLAKFQDSKSVKGKPYSHHSLADFRKAISKFWRWLYFDEYHGDAPPMIKRMKIANNEKRKPEIFSKEEIALIINGATNVRDKAFFSCLYDLQCRVSELLSRQKLFYFSH